MNEKDLEIPAYFTTNGKGIWELQGYCLHPTCKLKNLTTGQIEDFGMGGLTAEGFKRIQMPEVEK